MSRPRSVLARAPFLILFALILTALSPITSLAASPPFTSFWVQNFQPTHLWSSSLANAKDYGAIPQWSYLQVVAPQSTPRLYVLVPWTHNYAYVDAKSVGPSGPPPAGWLDAINPAKQVSQNPALWTGQVISAGLTVRTAPSVSAPVVQTLPRGTVVQAVAWVAGDQITYGDWTWAKLADGKYAYSEAMQIVRPSAPPPPPADHPSGKWVDINRLRQTAVAYQDSTPVHLAIVATGSPGWETPAGTHWIWGRVPDETMNSNTLSNLGLDTSRPGQAHYDIQHVLYTQYFDGLGDALHDNYWLPATEFGQPHSHGCVGMPVADAIWFWNWADAGVPVVVH